MNLLKLLAKKLFHLNAQANVSPVRGIVYLGSKFHGYYVPTGSLNNSSICYCVGAGTDISLDIELATKFGAQVFIFDPMPYAYNHFIELLNKTRKNEAMALGKDDDAYVYKISDQQLMSIKFIKTGLWNEEKLIRFYSPAKQDYAGHSITNLQKTDNYIEASVNTLKNIMQELGHSSIDLLKIEIEGSEYAVINNILADNIDVKIILVEFDEFHHRQGKTIQTLGRINNTSKQLLKAGYKLVHTVSYYKKTFVRNDVFEKLNNK